MNISPEIKLELERRVHQSRDVRERLRLCVVLARLYNKKRPHSSLNYRTPLNAYLRSCTKILINFQLFCDSTSKLLIKYLRLAPITSFESPITPIKLVISIKEIAISAKRQIRST